MSLTVIPPWKNPVTEAMGCPSSAGGRAIGDPRRDRVRADVVPVELDAEPGPLGDRVAAADTRVDMSERCQKNGSRSSSKHSTKVWSGTLARRCAAICGSS